MPAWFWEAFDPASQPISTDLNIDNHFLVIPVMTALAAFRQLSIMLNISCSLEDGFHVRTPANCLPPAVAPTTTQQLIPHKTFVDALPWPSFRDKLLTSMNVINETELALDLRQTRIWGVAPWNPMSWEIAESFARKWWFLMDENVLASTNFWRAQRGETPLVLGELASLSGIHAASVAC